MAVPFKSNLTFFKNGKRTISISLINMIKCKKEGFSPYPHSYGIV